MAKTWDIVFWTDQEAVNYVPSCWSNSTRTAYKWPVGPSRPGQPSPAQLIKRCQNITKNFAFFPAVFKKTVKTLEDAERYTEKGENGFSELDSKGGTSESDAAYSQTLTLNEDTSSGDDSRTEWRRPICVTPSDHSEAIVANATAASCTEQDRHLNVTDSNRQTTNLYHGNYHDVEQVLSTQQNDLGTCENQHSIIFTNSEKYLLKAISELTYEVREVKESINRMQCSLTLNNFQSVHPSLNNPSQEKQRQIMDSLPVKTKEELEKIEELIITNDLFDFLVEIFYLVGGDNYKTAMYSALKKLMVSSVAQQYSGQGKSRGGQKKGNFSDLRICAALKKAVRRRFESVTDAEFRDRLGTFLCTAKDREGGRKNRIVQNN